MVVIDKRNKLLDRVVPNFDHSHTESLVMPGCVEDIYPRVRQMEFERSWAVRRLYRLRGIPDFPDTVDGMIDRSFVLIGENAPHEFVLGAAGQFWKRDGAALPVTPIDEPDILESGLRWRRRPRALGGRRDRVIPQRF